MGITCVACHAPHEAHGANSPANTGPNAALLRQVPLPALLADIAPKQHSLGGPCLTCHSPDPATDTPAASSAAIWAARGGIDPISGRAMRGSANPKACVSCHNLPAPGADPTTRGADHAFAAHSEDGDEANTRLQARARQLWAEFLTRNVLHRATPPHSSPPSKSLPRHAAVLGATLDRDTPLGRAAYNVLLVGEDSGAGFHNPTYADELLTAAQRALTTPRSADAPSRKATP